MAALAEGVGIIMFLPLFQVLDASGLKPKDGESGGLVNDFVSLFYRGVEYFGLSSSATAILIVIAFAFFIKAALLFLSEGYTSYLTVKLLERLKNRMFDGFTRMSYGYYTGRNTGYFVNIINAQISQMLSVFASLLRLGVQATNVFIYIALALLSTWRFGVMSILISAVIAVFIRKLDKRILYLSRKTASENGLLTKLLIQSLHSFKYLAATAQMDHLRLAIRQSIANLAGYQIKANLFGVATKSIREPIIVISVVTIVIFQINYLSQPVSPIVVSLILFYRGLNALLLLQATFQSTLANVGSLELVQEEFDNQHKHQEIDGCKPISELKNLIQITDVTYSYPGNKFPSLIGINVTIPVLSTVAIIGESGSGKSTLADLTTLLIKPQSGTVAIDNIGHDEIRMDSWRRQVGYVSQEAVVFDDTIANNISMWTVDCHGNAELLAKIRDAARQANLDDFIQGLPDGYSTRVGDRGIRLSGGQRQRLFIARELFRKPRLLILDEATSALDSEAERVIQDSILGLKGRVTVILIAHRLNTIRIADLVYILKSGRIAEYGTYVALRDREDSLLNSMIRLQDA